MHPEAGINISQDISMSKLKMNKEYLNDDELDKTQNGYGDYNDLNNNAQDNSQQLPTLILKQLEFYFSRENLLNDKYLQSQMDSDNYVPICVLITFNMMKKIFSNSNLAHSLDDERIKYVQNVIKQTNNSLLQLDPSQTKIRANHKRCVVILREIDKDTPLEQIESLFSTCKVKCLNYEFAGSSSWYLTFKDESEAQIAVQFIKEEVRTFNNQPLFARIKTSPLPRLNSTNTEFINNNNNNESLTKHYSQYQPYYYSDMSQIVNPNPWMIYPNFSTNYNNKLKQTTTDTTSNLSSSSANYIINPFDPYMLSFNGAHHQYKNNQQQQQQRRNYYRFIKDNNDLNQTSQNEPTFNQNQNFIIFPTQAPFVYPNDFVYPIPFAVNQSLTQIASSSSASSSSSTKQNNNYQKKIPTKRYQATPNPNNNNSNNNKINNSDNLDSYKKNKYPRPNGNKVSNGYNRKSRIGNNGFNSNNRKNESDLSLVQFDYEPTSFPPLKDGEIKSEIIEPELDLENNNDVELNSDNSPWSAYSRRSFAEIVKHKQLNGLVDELNKVKIAEE
ncbi:unnamed protein product [Brachionus calyciflorus]|uniref:HTH La-type RNA-binding domain-containing protein n=1 Tax=Brachionus calyciflorus TaxID=104777 RepID=A0A813ZWR4_9BILA|nr:unnamed protein product [Brachionus calyciflorus]